MSIPPRLIGVNDQRFVPTVTQLRVFVAVAERLHFRQAAADLGLSQPSLSQSLATLEDGLGTRLVERSTRTVFLTPEGDALLPAAREALRAVDDFVDLAVGGGGPLSGPLRLGLIPTAAPYLLPGLLTGLARRHPEAQPRVVEDQTARLLDALRAGTLDVAVLAVPTGAAGVTEVPLYREPFALVVPAGHELDGRDDLGPDVLGTQPLLLLDEGHCLRDQTLDLCRRVSAPVLGRGDTRAASLATAVRCVAGGLGVTLVPESAVATETLDPALGVARFADPAPGRTMGLVMRSATARGGGYAELGRLVAEVAVADCGATAVSEPVS